MFVFLLNIKSLTSRRFVLVPKNPPSPFDEELGCVCSRKNTITNEWVILYDGEEAGMNTKDGRWQMYCSEHGSVISETNKTRAKKALKTPEQWCKSCKRKTKAKIGQPMRKVVDIQDDDKLEREMRFWANKARDNPEKCQIFEKIYGVKPDGFWD